jgi:digeranylgeranylglycerophospholipid reductase
VTFFVTPAHPRREPMEEHDVIVAGGGPAGARAARAAAEEGVDTLLLERRREAGRPIQCAGLVTPRVFAHNESRVSVVNEVRGSRFHSPSGRRITIDAGKVKAFVIDRGIFDKEMLADAGRAGAEVRMGCRLESAGYVREDGGSGEGGGQVEVRVSRGGVRETLRCRVLIGADGPGSVVRRAFGLAGPKEMLAGAQVEVPVKGADQDFVSVFTGEEVASGYFAWAIPAEDMGGGARLMRVGLCVPAGRGGPWGRLFRFLGSDLFSAGVGEPSQGSVLSLGGGLIPLGPSKESCADSVMLAGDAASMAKPTSGGGVFTGLTAGEISGRAAAGACRAGDTSKKALLAYQREWMAAFGKELKKGLTLRRAFMNLDDAKIEKAFSIIDDPKIIELIESKGDIDYPVGMAKAVLKKAPKLMSFAGPVLKAVLF